jgi:hypothetical protein
MALQKQPVNIDFSKGLDTKTDPYQIPLGNFARLKNMVFDKAKRLTKRNGYGQITVLPNPVSFLTTFQENLTGIGKTLQAFSAGSNTWVAKGNLQPVSLTTLPLIRNNYTQTQVDTAVSNNNLVCTVYTETGNGSTTYKYAVADSITGQNILPPAVIPTTITETTAPRVFFLGIYFVIVFGTAASLRYVAISSVLPVAPTVSTTFSALFTPDSRMNFDGVVANNSLYIAWNGSDIGGSIRVGALSATLIPSSTHVITGQSAQIMSISADNSGITPNLYVSWWNSTSNNISTAVLSHSLGIILGTTTVVSSQVITNLTTVSNNGLETLYYEIPNNYTYDASIPTHYISTNTVTVTGTVGTPGVFARSVGLASKAFQIDGDNYVLGVYVSPTQPTYFLFNGLGQVVSRLAYSNGGGYRVTGLPEVNVNGFNATVGYEYADLVQAVNKSQGLVSPLGVYSQTGINSVTFTLGTIPKSVEIGNTLNLTGGFLWTYDGYSPVENDFFLWPDSIEATTATTGGALTEQTYFYQVLYEWTDNQGNPYRSAPSIPISVVTTGTTSANTINIPTLRLTYKLANPVKITIYRWSTGQQNYYEITSILLPLLNDTAVDSVQFVDTRMDSDILGNALIYTTGGVVEDVGAPSFNSLTLFDDRLWGIDAEDPNLLWYSKQVIENTPVEMSDLFTLYVAPSISAQGSTGETKCIVPMDDKLILFKRDALYYINGSGPDNTGANSQYSQPTFIASTVGSENQSSIVYTPMGLMFQSDKGIWLLDRGLNTSYIGAPVEDYTIGAVVQSAVNVPGTNQIRFTLDTGITLMFDYFFQQWGTFEGVPAISSTLYRSLHTYVDTFNRVFQETPGIYLDGSNPVLQGFTTGWVASAGLQGYQRIYWMHLLGTYYSPHTLSVQIAYDYNSNPVQQTSFKPNNFSGPWGSLPNWGSAGAWGGSTNVEKGRIFFAKMKCQSFQVVVDEVFDSSFGTVAGAGLTLSGLNLTIGIKKSYRTQSAAQEFS